MNASLPREAMNLEQELAALHDKSFGWALACCRRDRNEAEEVLQETYWKILEGRAKWGGRSTLKTWLFGVIRVTAREHRRRAIFRWLKDSPPPSQRLPDVSLDDRRAAAALSVALAQLSDRQREVLHLVFYEELTIEEAAEVMDVALGTARLHYERGKKNLRQLLLEKR
jgi:RNA polymerase sigma-70 factor (ECF subfamily)